MRFNKLYTNDSQRRAAREKQLDWAIRLSRVWLLFVLAVVAILGAVSLPYYAWKIGGYWTCGIGVVLTALAVWCCGKFGDRF